MELTDLLTDVGQIAAFGAVGLLLMGLGYAMVDILTPGKLHELVWDRRNANAAFLVAANMLSVALIVTVAIWASYSDFGAGIVSTLAYGIVGLAIMAVCFLLMDALTPGKLGALLTGDDRHPAVWVTSAAHFGVAMIVCAAII